MGGVTSSFTLPNQLVSLLVKNLLSHSGLLETRKPPVGETRRNAVPLNLTIAANVYVSLVVILAQTMSELFNYTGWTSFMHFYAVLHNILQPAESCYLCHFSTFVTQTVYDNDLKFGNPALRRSQVIRLKKSSEVAFLTPLSL